MNANNICFYRMTTYKGRPENHQTQIELSSDTCLSGHNKINENNNKRTGNLLQYKQNKRISKTI